MNDENLNRYIGYIRDCVEELYNNEKELFENNLCERCLVFRFAHFIQNKFDNNIGNNSKYYVDCDYNSSTYFNKKTGKWERRNGKPIPDDEQGGAKITKRFIDIIVHRRKSHNSDLICFELKKWNNCTRKGVKKDKNNLKILTSVYGYEYGFHLIFGKTKDKTEIEIFKNGEGSGLNLLFSNQNDNHTR